MNKNLVVLVIINACLLVFGQTLFKLGVNSIGKLELSISQIIYLIFNKYIFCGILLYAFTVIFWLYILSKGDLSYIYPIQSVCYILALIISIVVFKENVTLNRWIGSGIIMIGVYVISMK